MWAATVLIIAIVLTGLMAGLYFAFTTAVMPGLSRASAQTYVTAMQRIDESILNPWFLSTFLGALIAPVVAAVLHFGEDERVRLPWIIAAAVLYGSTIVITSVVNVPLNNALRSAGPVDDSSAPAAKDAYHQRWTRFNNARTMLSLAALIALAIAVAQPVG